MARLSARGLTLVAVWILCLSTVYVFYRSKGNINSDSNIIQGNSTLIRMATKLEFTETELRKKAANCEGLSQRIHELNIQLQQNAHIHEGPSDVAEAGAAPKRNVTESPLMVPNLFQLMPHLEGDIQALYPHRSVGHAKHGVDMVMAVPHVHREKEDYLVRTIQSLLDGMRAEDRSNTVIVVMVAEPWEEKHFDDVVQELRNKFSSHIDQGLIEVILPPAKWYPDLDHLPEKWGDKPDRARWRTKQNLDYAFMMLYCSHIGRLYVQLEDDITAKNEYIKSMKDYSDQIANWELLEFSQLGFIGKMFHSSMLPKFVSFILMFYKHKPVDWILDDYFYVQECHGKSCSNLAHIRKRFRPSLFQHEGYHSSLAGKVQKLKDKDFGKAKGQGAAPKDPPVFRHANPQVAKLDTSLKVYGKYELTKLYLGTSVFWSLNPQPGDHIDILFAEPTIIKKYVIVSGDQQHCDDRFGSNTTIELLPSDPSKSVRPRFALPLTRDDDFVVFQYFNTTWKRPDDDSTSYTAAIGDVPELFGAVSAVRIVNHIESQAWLIINEMWFLT